MSTAFSLWGTITRLFHRSNLNLLFLSTISFFILIGLVGIRLLYLSSLDSSLSDTVPHLTLIPGGSIPRDLATARNELADQPEIESVSLIAVAQRRLKLQGAESVGIVGTYQFDAPVELYQLEHQRFPFPIPLEHAEPLLFNAKISLTSRELAADLMFDPQAVVVNEAFANLIRPRPSAINLFHVSDSRSGLELGGVRIVAVLRDLREVPVLYGGSSALAGLMPESTLQGIAIRLRDTRHLEAVRDKLSTDYGSSFRIRTWKDAHQQQQDLFRVFDVIYWVLFLSVFSLTLIVGVLGIYRTFIARRVSLAILLLLGVSRRQLYWNISAISIFTLLGGALLAMLGLSLIYVLIQDSMLVAMSSFLPVESIQLPLKQVVIWTLTLGISNFLLSLVFIRLMVHTRLSLN
jgi:hypothetical protein